MASFGGFLALLALFATEHATAGAPNVWPLPVQLQTAISASRSVLSPDLALVRVNIPEDDDVTASAIARYNTILRNSSTGTPNSTIVANVSISVDPSTDTDVLGLSTPYNYSLQLAEGASTILLNAASRFGVAHGLETIAQLYARNTSNEFSKFTVVDGPTFPYRAIMIDCGRRFVPIRTLKELLDGMSYSKMSVLNLHASEYGSFRVQVNAVVCVSSYAS